MVDALFDTVTPFVQKYTWNSGALTSVKINAFLACKPTINGFQNPDACEPHAPSSLLSLCVLVLGVLQYFHLCQKKIHEFRTIFTSAAGFLLASCDKKVTHVTQRFFLAVKGGYAGCLQ